MENRKIMNNDDVLRELNVSEINDNLGENQIIDRENKGTVGKVAEVEKVENLLTGTSLKKNYLIENESLKEICHLINSGLIQDEVSTLEIKSDKFPEFIIKIVDVNITEYIFNLVRDTQLKDKVDQLETTFYDFIVLTITTDEETNKRTLMVSSLFELMMSKETISTLNDEGIDENLEDVWNGDSRVWNLVKVL